MRKEERRKALKREVKKETERRRNRRFRGGYTIIELGLAIAVVLLLVGTIFYAWRTFMGRGETESAVRKTQAIVSLIDSVCQGNGGICPAVDTDDITTDPTISVYLPKNKTPYKGIGYTCDEGDDQEVEIRIPLRFFHADEDRARELCKTAADNINKNYGDRWVADRNSCDGDALVITSQHRVCQPY